MSEASAAFGPLVDVRDLTKSYGDEQVTTAALNGVSFSIAAGEFVAIMGPSGSGKSTLLHILGFLDHPTGGSYRFEGKTIDEYEPHVVARVRNERMGFVFQAFNLLKRTSLLDNVTVPLVYSAACSPAERSTRAHAALDAVGLSHRVNHVPAEISGGEKQRTAIARAIVNDPAVIFADEPTGNLDSKSGAVVLDIFRDLHARGKTVILITHDADVAAQTNRVIRIKDGQLESDNSTR